MTFGSTHISVTGTAQAALTTVLQTEKVVISDIIDALQAVPPPLWVAPLIPFALELLPFLKAVAFVNSFIP